MSRGTRRRSRATTVSEGIGAIGGAEGEKRISVGDGAAAGSSERQEEEEKARRKGKMKKKKALARQV